MLSLILFNHSVKFKRSDAFIGYQEDTPAAVVFQASNIIRSAISAVKACEVDAERNWERVLQWCKLEHESGNIEEQDSKTWNEAVSSYRSSLGCSYLIIHRTFKDLWVSLVLFLASQL